MLYIRSLTTLGGHNATCKSQISICFKALGLKTAKWFGASVFLRKLPQPKGQKG